MNSRRGLVVGVTALLCALVLPATAQASVSYRSAVLARHPIAYWRLGETSGSVARRFMRRGYQVHEASSGEEALTLAERRQFDVQPQLQLALL